jgi:hypothetical protein
MVSNYTIYSLIVIDCVTWIEIDNNSTIGFSRYNSFGLRKAKDISRLVVKFKFGREIRGIVDSKHS